MKVLLTASVLVHITSFHQPLIQLLKNQGHEVHVAAYKPLQEKKDFKLEHVDKLFNIPFHRNPFHPQNISAYRQLRHIIETEGYGVIHCNTPAVGVLTRLAARHSRKALGTKVFYMAHGFHFYQGAPMLNWLLYYPIEKFMCRYTDTLITINEEDTRLAKERFSVNTVHVHGVGVDAENFFPVGEEEKRDLRQQLGIAPEARVILCIGELNANKNQQVLIRAAALMVSSMPAIKVLLAGRGPCEQKLRALIHELKLEEHVSLLGYCSNIQQYIQASDIVVSCSFREGLPVNIIEAMLSGKPVVASRNRGHRELVKDGATGFLVTPDKPEAYVARILPLLNDRELFHNCSRAASERGNMYSAERIGPQFRALYGIVTD